MTLQTGPIELAAFAPGDGPIVSLSEIGSAGPVDIGAAVVPSGICTPTPDQCATGLATGPFAADLADTGARLFSLAKITVDTTTDSDVLYIDTGGVPVAAATADFAAVSIDPALNIVTVTYSKNPPAGTMLNVTFSLADGRSPRFQLAIA